MPIDNFGLGKFALETEPVVEQVVHSPSTKSKLDFELEVTILFDMKGGQAIYGIFPMDQSISNYKSNHQNYLKGNY